MGAGVRKAVGRWVLATSVALVCTVAAAQTPRDSTAPGAKTIRHEQDLRDLQPLFRHLALAVLQEIRRFEQRPDSAPGEWTEPLRRLSASLARPAPLDTLT